MKNKKSISKLSLLLNAALIGITVYSCSTQSERTASQTCPGGPFPPECNCMCLDSSTLPSFQPIHGNLLDTMAKLFQHTRNEQNELARSGHTEYPLSDASSVWFALDDIKRFIWEIEHRVCQKNCDSILNLGVRIYYARYPKATDYGFYRPDLDLIPTDYEKMHTVFMIPTFDQPDPDERDKIDHIDFDLNGTCPPRALSTYDTTFVALMPTGKNHGTLCPPICSGAAFGN